MIKQKKNVTKLRQHLSVLEETKYIDFQIKYMIDIIC